MATWCKNLTFDETAEVAVMCVCRIFSFESALKLFVRRRPTKQAGGVESRQNLPVTFSLNRKDYTKCPPLSVLLSAM